jgi:hypothetical protein
MFDDLAYWWRASWKSRLGVQICFAVLIVVLPWLAYDAYTESERWAAYKAEHHCRLLQRPLEGGPTADGERNGYWLYHCDGGIPVKRLPTKP